MTVFDKTLKTIITKNKDKLYLRKIKNMISMD